jgi:hypothetical protein
LFILEIQLFASHLTQRCLFFLLTQRRRRYTHTECLNFSRQRVTQHDQIACVPKFLTQRLNYILSQQREPFIIIIINASRWSTPLINEVSDHSKNVWNKFLYIQTKRIFLFMRSIFLYDFSAKSSHLSLRSSIYTGIPVFIYYPSIKRFNVTTPKSLIFLIKENLSTRFIIISQIFYYFFHYKTQVQ